MDRDTRIGLLRRQSELLIGFFVVVALLLIVLSFLLEEGDPRDVVRGIGLSLLPAGIIAFLLARFAAAITEMLLREAVTMAVQERLEADMDDIKRSIEKALAQIDEDMKHLSPLFISASKLGLENVHLTREQALDQFAWFLDGETQRAERGESARVWIVSSSIMGFFRASTEHFDGRRMMESLTKGGCDTRIMMTAPEMADLRAHQEDRGQGDIPKEIEMSLGHLKRAGVQRESVRLYPGAPTVFAIATTDRMLLNPYPYETEAFRCFSIIVHETLNPMADIFHQYLRFHFEEPWQRAMPVDLNLWNRV